LTESSHISNFKSPWKRENMCELVKKDTAIEPPSPMDEEFAVALDTAMPPTGGLRMGIDRIRIFLALPFHQSPSIYSQATEQKIRYIFSSTLS
jgi:elongation factor P--beta-lysine ligase